MSSCDGVYTWGNGTGGRLGHGDEKISTSPTPVEFFSSQGLHIKDVVCGATHTAAITSDGALYTWGNGRHGRLGLGTDANQTSPSLVEVLRDEKVTQVATGEAHMIALTESGKVFAWGRGPALGLGDGVNGTIEPTLVSFFNGLEVAHIACGKQHTLVVTKDGEAYAFGQGREGQLGHGQPFGPQESLPRRIEFFVQEGNKVSQAICIGDSTMFLCDDVVYACGSDSYGQIGLSRAVTRVQQPTIVTSLSQLKISQLHGGALSMHAAATSITGEVYMWGLNTNGQLGNDSTKDALAPIEIKQLRGAKEIALGGRHTMALLPNGNVLVFGAGREGQLGLGRNRKVESVAAGRSFPVLLDVLEGQGVKISCGTDHAAALAKGLNDITDEDRKAI